MTKHDRKNRRFFAACAMAGGALLCLVACSAGGSAAAPTPATASARSTSANPSASAAPAPTATQAACKSLITSLAGFDRFQATDDIDVDYVTITWAKQLKTAAALATEGPMMADFEKVRVASEHWNLDGPGVHTEQEGVEAMRLIRGVAVKCADLAAAPTT